MKRKRIMGTLLALALAVAVMIPAAAAVTYSDVDSHWAKAAIEIWSDRGIIEGDGGRFLPGNSITRGELAAILQRAMNYQTVQENSFSDLNGDAWYTEYILKAAAAGVMEGDGQGRARPMDKVTRQEAAVMFARAFGFQDESQAELPYSDASQIAGWALSAVSGMTQRGYLEGDGGRFRPNGNLTRAEAVTILNNIVQGFYRAPGTYQESVAGNALVNVGGVTLKDMTVSGDLYLSAGAVGLPVTLENVTVTGKIVNQSGQEPIFVKNEEKPNPDPDPTPDPTPDPEAERAAFLAQFPAMEGMKGIDVSNHQGEIDWARVKQAGVEFAMIRVGFTGYGTGSRNLDQRYRQNIEGALQNGIRVGVYYYSQAISTEEAEAEASLLLDAISGYDITFPVVFDWETIAGGRANDLDTQTLCDAANTFCSMVASRGYTPMVYFNRTLGMEHYDLSQLTQYDFWYAYLRPLLWPIAGYDVHMWQFSHSGVVPGIEGKVDLNLSLKPYL